MPTCIDCRKFSYLLTDGRCKKCYGRKFLGFNRKPKNRPRGQVAMCKLCKEGIYGRSGTYLPGVGAVHKPCEKAKKRLEVLANGSASLVQA